MTLDLTLSLGDGSKRDYSQDPRADRRLRFILDRLAREASRQGLQYIDRVLSGVSSRPKVTVSMVREALAEVRYEMDRVTAYRPTELEAAFELAWNDHESLVA